MIYVVTRHVGAIKWLEAQKIYADLVCAHLDIDQIKKGDQVIGILPVHLAAMVCEKGGRYFHLCIDIPAEKRGQELSSEELNSLKAYIKEYKITE